MASYLLLLLSLCAECIEGNEDDNGYAAFLLLVVVVVVADLEYVCRAAVFVSKI